MTLGRYIIVLVCVLLSFFLGVQYQKDHQLPCECEYPHCSFFRESYVKKIAEEGNGYFGVEIKKEIVSCDDEPNYLVYLRSIGGGTRKDWHDFIGGALDGSSIRIVLSTEDLELITKPLTN
jgi:hypothetical protein